MLKLNKAEIKAIIVTALLIAVAFVLSFDLFHNSILEAIQPQLRDAIYVAIFIAWGIRSYRQVAHKQIRICMLVISTLMVLWFIVRRIKYSYIIDVDGQRYLWYSYYIPIVQIPTVTFFVTMLIDKNESQRPTPQSYLPFVVSVSLSLSALTNDLHQKFFYFNGSEVWTDTEYSYGILYYLSIVWIVICVSATFYNLVKKSRVLKKRYELLLPLAPIMALILYTVLYITSSPITTDIIGDFTAVSCVMIIIAYSALFKIGLIRVNSRYKDLFNATVNTSAQIVDNENNIKYSAADSISISESQIRELESGDIALSKSSMLKSSPISGGRVIWVEDFGEQIELKEELESLREELEDRNELLKYQYKKDKERTEIEQQNRLYDLLQKNTQTQIDKITLLVTDYKNANSKEDKNIILCQVAVLCSFIKRRKHLTLSIYNSQSISPSELDNALKESLKTLGLLGVRYNHYLDLPDDEIDGELVSLAYDFYECVIEQCLDNIDTVMVSISTIDDVLRITMNVKCEGSLYGVSRFYPNAIIDDADEDGWFVILPLVKGGDELC